MKPSALFVVGGAAALTVALACSPGGEEGRIPVPGVEGAVKSTAEVRAARRAFDGAPPVIPHEGFGVACQDCHDADGSPVADLGYAPPNPHLLTPGLGETARCEQCHVFQQSDGLFTASVFEPLRQDLRRGERWWEHAPPLIPHGLLLRENCLACHAGPAAREEIRCTHPERPRCLQCHLVQEGSAVFERP